jgi:hypothetical protein
MKHGRGEWRKVSNNPKCNKFEGEYKFDKKNGSGTFTWESGNIYHGGYINDERMGYGEMYWTDGSVYKGEWYKGIQHGTGIMTFPDGRIKDGLFENNVFKGSVPADYTKEKAIEAFYAKNGAGNEDPKRAKSRGINGINNKAELSDNQSYKVSIVNKNKMIETGSIRAGGSERPAQLSPVVQKNGSIKGI